jgi:hypothetical protein
MHPTVINQYSVMNLSGKILINGVPHGKTYHLSQVLHLFDSKYEDKTPTE